jgi:hypothetical protein
MFIREIVRASVCAGTLALGLWTASASSETQTAKSQATFRPIQSIRYDFGSKSVRGYFVSQSAKCAVMLWVYELSDPDKAPPPSGARVRLLLDPGQIAGLDSEEGRSLNITCGDGATALLVDAGEIESLTELQQVGLRKTAGNASRN